MHVLFVCSWYPDHLDPSLGIFIRRHAEAVSPFCQVSLISFTSGLSESIVISQKNGVNHLQISFPKSKQKKALIKDFLDRNKLFTSAVKEAEKLFGPVDLVQLNVVFPAILWMYRYLVRMKQPLIIAEHWSGYLRHDGRYQGLLMKFFTFSAFRRSSLILTVSGAQRAAMISQGLKGEFEYLPNVADEKIFFADDKIQRLSDTWIHVSNLDPLEKNTSMLLSLFAHQYHAGKVKRMIVCGGTTSMVEDFRKQVVNAGLADVIEILGNISPAELNIQMNRASVFLLCSHFEGQPCVILEAILSGLVVVAPATGDIPDMLSEGRGFVFSVGNFEGAIKALNEAVSSTFLPASAEYVKNRYSSSSVGRYLFDHYSKVLE
ncbi:MAG: hypothetical protein RLZZ46_1432 [Bacteroidota bacterium]|jgi:glycosyltransferase involved in cell wall biosynthesis